MNRTFTAIIFACWAACGQKEKGKGKKEKSSRFSFFPIAFSLLASLCGASFAEEAAAPDSPTVQATPAAKVYVVEIHGEINPAMLAFVSRSVEKAKGEKATHVVFSIDTFGGRVDSALKITTVIGSVEPATTVAYVPFAAGAPSFFSADPTKGVSWSAGALISLACKHIYMAPGTSIGAAAPVYQTPDGIVMAEEKVVSAVRAAAQALAEMNDHPKAIARAMVDSDVELVEAIADDKHLAVTYDDFTEMQREADKTGKEITLGRTISPQGKLLTLTAKEAEQYGLSAGTVATIPELLSALGLKSPSVVEMQQNPADSIIALLTSPTATTLLVVIALITLYLEITSPGFGLAGTVSIICFAIIFGSNFLLGRVGSVEILVFLTGVCMLMIELFLIPGFGVIGIAGILLIMASLVLSMQDFTIPQFSWQWDVLVKNLVSVVIGVTVSFVVIGLLMHYLSRVPVFNKLMLTTAQPPEQGYTVQPADAAQTLLGARGMSTTTLRPSGKAQIGNKTLVVETDGEFVERGSQVEVIAVDGNRVIVRKL